MYLSRVYLDLSNRNTLKAVNSRSVLHGAVEAALTDDRSRKLWRIDSLGGELYLMILSNQKPDLSVIASQFGDTSRAGETREYDGLLGRIKKGDIWQFRLTANPVKTDNVKQGQGKKRAVTIVDFQKQWLIDRAEKNGFCLSEDSFDVVQNKWCHFYKKEERPVTLLSVTFEGLLEVTDEELFKNMLLNGLGRGKAYGMGLMTVMRPGNNTNG